MSKMVGLTSFYYWIKFNYIYIYHIFLTHSSVERHLDCFDILVIIEHAERNKETWMCRYPPEDTGLNSFECIGVGLQDPMVVWFLISLTSIVFSAMAVPIYIPTNTT